MLEALQRLSKLYIPLYSLDNLLKSIQHLSSIQEFLLKELSSFLYNRNLFTTFFSNDYKLYVAHSILPRIIFLILFIIDIFYFHQFYLIYICILLGIIPLIKSYIIYSIKQLLEKDILYIEKNFYIQVIEEENEECSYVYLSLNKDEEGCVDIRNFLEVQVAGIKWAYTLYKYECIETWYAREEYAKKHNIDLCPLTIFSPNSDEIARALSPKFYEMMPHMIHMQAFLESDRRIQVYVSIKEINIIITFMYFICWFSILVMSIHTLNIVDLVELLTSTWINIEDPFSNVPLLDENETKFK